jgi:argininosuccinate lyase
LENAYQNVDMNPLGSCALAGTSFPIDRKLTTKLLGFSGLHKHSLDAISSRDFIAETLCALAIHMSNLSKLAEEMVYWSTFEFNLITLDDRYTA